MLDGHPEPAQIVAKALELGRTSIALTDHGSISGHVLFEKAVQGKASISVGANTLHVRDGQALDIKPIYGMEAYAVNDVTQRTDEQRKKYHISLLAKNPRGYRNLLQLVTRSWGEGFYYRQSVDGSMVLDHHEGLMVLSGCESSSFMKRIERGDYEGALALAMAWKSAFGDDFYIELQHFPHTSEKAALAYQIAQRLGIKPVLTCDAHYLEPDGWRYQQFLWAVRDARPVDDFRIEHAYLWEPERLLAFCREHHPSIQWEAVFENTCEAAAKCERYDLPKAPNVRYQMDGDKLEWVRQTCLGFLQERGLYTDQYLQRLGHELDVVVAKGYLDYFLVVADMIRWAKGQGIFVGPARGSAAGSLVCWALRITEVDPLRFGLLFERFVDPTRTDLPDIDVDFEDERRHEVFAYMQRKYGAECTAGISTFMRLGGKSALDDAARSYRIPKADIETIKRHLVERSSGDQRAELTITDTLDEFPEAREVWERHPALGIVAGVEGKIRSTGKHAAGLVVTSEPISNYVATIGQEDKLVAVDWRDAAHLNLMKIDCLGLKEMTLLRLITGRIGWTVDDLYRLPLDDQETFDGFNRHDFLGIFQFTGLATKGIASRVAFANIEQVGDVNALSRPGPLHAGATEAYLQGHRSGNFAPILPQPAVRPIISDTYGQIIYQEQVMRILRDIGGMDWQSVCDIRTIMGKSKGSEAMDKYWPQFVTGCGANGYGEQDAKQIWDCIRLMGKHSFNKCIAADSLVGTSGRSIESWYHHPGEYLDSLDEETGVLVRNRVRRVYRTGRKRCLRVQWDGGELECTAEHRIWTQRGWVQADGLRIGDFVAAAVGSQTDVEPSGCKRTTENYSCSQCSAEAQWGHSRKQGATASSRIETMGRSKSSDEQEGICRACSTDWRTDTRVSAAVASGTSGLGTRTHVADAQGASGSVLAESNRARCFNSQLWASHALQDRATSARVVGGCPSRGGVPNSASNGLLRFAHCREDGGAYVCGEEAHAAGGEVSGVRGMAADSDKPRVGWVPVIGICDCGHRDTYDIEVEGPNNSYLANGIVVHNSHALSYGIIAYWSMHMKVHYPLEFYWAQLVKCADDAVAARFIAEAQRKGIHFEPFGLDAPSATWWLTPQRTIAPGWSVLKGIGEKAGAELAARAPFADIADLVARVNRRICNSKVQAVVAEATGLEVDRIFGLDRWAQLAAIVGGERATIGDVNEGLVWGGPCLIAGRLNRINKKNRLEEYKSRGQDTSRIDASKPQDYVILILEDETDSMMCYVSPELYQTIKAELWHRGEGCYVAAYGNRVPGIQLLSAKNIGFVDIQDSRAARPRTFADGEARAQ